MVTDTTTLPAVGSVRIKPEMRVRIHRFLAGLSSPAGVDLELDVDLDADTLRPLPMPGDTFDARVVKVYGNHPTNPTRYELRVVREDTGDEIYCPLSSVVAVLPGLPPAPTPKRTRLTETGRFRASLLDAICGPVLETEVDDPDFLSVPPANIHVRIRSKHPTGPDELAVDL